MNFSLLYYYVVAIVMIFSSLCSATKRRKDRDQELPLAKKTKLEEPVFITLVSSKQLEEPVLIPLVSSKPQENKLIEPSNSEPVIKENFENVNFWKFSTTDGHLELSFKDNFSMPLVLFEMSAVTHVTLNIKTGKNVSDLIEILKRKNFFDKVARLVFAHGLKITEVEVKDIFQIFSKKAESWALEIQDAKISAILMANKEIYDVLKIENLHLSVSTHSDFENLEHILIKKELKKLSLKGTHTKVMRDNASDLLAAVLKATLANKDIEELTLDWPTDLKDDLEPFPQSSLKELTLVHAPTSTYQILIKKFKDANINLKVQQPKKKKLKRNLLTTYMEFYPKLSVIE